MELVLDGAGDVGEGHLWILDDSGVPIVAFVGWIVRSYP